MHQNPYSFIEFNKPTTKEWLKKLRSEIGEERAEKILSYSVERDLVIPAYIQTDESASNAAVKFLNVTKKEDNKWNYFQYITLNKSHKEANENILSALSNGAEGVILDGSGELPFAVLLKNVLPEFCYISFIDVHNTAEIKKYLDWADSNRFKQSTLHGFVRWAGDQHELKNNPQVKIVQYSEAFRDLDRAVNLKFIAIQSTDISAFGGSAQTQLTKICSSLVYVINALLGVDFNFSEIVNRVWITVDIGNDYFLELAKIRAIKWLTNNIVSQYDTNFEAFEIHIHADTSMNSKPVRDDKTNYLRCTTEAMSAILGGVDSLSIDACMSKRYSTRIERNISNLLNEESYLAKVVDPGAGSYFIENLTATLIAKVWEKFTSVESKGGYEWAIRSGYFLQECKADKEFMDNKAK